MSFTALLLAAVVSTGVQVLDDGLFKVVRQDEAEPVARMTAAVKEATEHCQQLGKLVRLKEVKHFPGEPARTEVVFRCE